jgi:hypothetical protein
VTWSEKSARCLQTEWIGVQGYGSALEIKEAALEISVVSCVTDLIAANIKIWRLESDDRSVHGAIYKSRAKIETNVRNHETINVAIENITNSIIR